MGTCVYWTSIMPKSNLSLVTAALFTITAALLAGCSTPEISKSDLEQGAMKQLTANVGKQCPQITCPGNLKAEVGAKVVCSMPIDGKTYDVNIAVDSIDSSTKTAHYAVQVADKPRD
jgi:hypothetical protein